MKLVFSCKNENVIIRREDPVELKNNDHPSTNNTHWTHPHKTPGRHFLVGATLEKNKSSKPIDHNSSPRPTHQSTNSNLDPIQLINEPSYPRDNSAISSKSPYRQGGLRPRCWIRSNPGQFLSMNKNSS